MNCQPCGVIVHLVFGLQVHGRRVSTESCRGGAQAGRQLWRPLLDRGRKRRRKAGFLVCATKPRRRTAVEDAKSWRHGRLGPRCGRGGDGRRAASRAVTRPRRERRLGPRRGGGNLPARGVLAVFSKSATYPGFADPSKTANRIFIDTAASRRRLRVEERTSAVG